MWNFFLNFHVPPQCHFISFISNQFTQSIIIKYNLKNNISIVASLTHGFCDVVTSEMITDLNNDGKVRKQSNQVKRNKQYPDETD